MSKHVYKMITLVGSSPDSIDDAVERAINKANDSVDEMRWFKVEDIRGHIEDGQVAHYQVTVEVGFTIKDSQA